MKTGHSILECTVGPSMQMERAWHPYRHTSTKWPPVVQDQPIAACSR
jgi:hypothetical protein